MQASEKLHTCGQNFALDNTGTLVPLIPQLRTSARGSSRLTLSAKGGREQMQQRAALFNDLVGAGAIAILKSDCRQPKHKEWLKRAAGSFENGYAFNVGDIWQSRNRNSDHC